MERSNLGEGLKREGLKGLQARIKEERTEVVVQGERIGEMARI